MDSHKYLVIIKGTDKTLSVRSCREDNNCFFVEYMSSGTEYPVSKKSIVYLNNPERIALQHDS
jgi:hypothetical protein